MPSNTRKYKAKKLKRWTVKQIDFLRENYGVIPLTDISRKLNKKKQAIRYKAHQLKLKYKYKRGITLLDIRSKLENSPIKINEEYKGDVQVEFICPFCHEIFIALPSHIFSKQTKSCGCQNKKTIRAKKLPYVSSIRFSIIKAGAKSRSLEFDITPEYINYIMIEQNFKCKLSGLKITANNIDGIDSASLDRIDNTKGYIEGNVQWVHKILIL